MRQLQRDLPGDRSIASVEWVTDDASKGPDDTDWVHHGAGLVIGSYGRTEVPPDIIDRVGGIDVVFSAPDPSILAGKTVDVQKGRFVIRD